MSKTKNKANPTHVVGKAHPVETQGVTNSSQPLMSEDMSGILSTEKQRPTATTVNNPTDLDSSDQPCVTGSVAQSTPDLLDSEEHLSATPNDEAGSPSVSKAKVVEEKSMPEAFRKAAIGAYLEDQLNEISTFCFENIRVLVADKDSVIYRAKVTVSLVEVLSISEELYALKDCFVVEPTFTLTGYGTVEYETYIRCKWSEKKEKEALNFISK